MVSSVGLEQQQQNTKTKTKKQFTYILLYFWNLKFLLLLTTTGGWLMRVLFNEWSFPYSKKKKVPYAGWDYETFMHYHLPISPHNNSVRRALLLFCSLCRWDKPRTQITEAQIYTMTILAQLCLCPESYPPCFYCVLSHTQGKIFFSSGTGERALHESLESWDGSSQLP